jgi:type I restriction enzyme S subunit
MSGLPASWVVTTLGEIKIDQSQGIVPAQFPNEQFELFSVPSHPSGVAEILRGGDIGSNKQTVVAGVVLLCKINPRINRVWVVEPKTELRTIASTEWASFWPREEINPHYLANYLRQNCVRDFLAQHASGVGGSLMRVKPSTFAHFPFVLAPRREQDRIVAEIDKQFTRLDAATAALKRVQANLKRYRASVLKAACEGRLVPTEAELARKEGRDYEPAGQLLKRILRERRARWEADTLAKLIASGKRPTDDRWKLRYKEPATPDITDAPELPAGWAWASADQVCSQITDGEHITPERTTSGVYLLSARNVRDGELVLDEVDYVSPDTHAKLSMRLAITAGDVLLSCSGSVGRCCVVPPGVSFSLVRSVAVLKPLLLLPDYLSFAIRSDFIQGQIREKSTQTAQANIFQARIKSLLVPLPPLDEQYRIVESCSERLRTTQRSEAEIMRKIAHGDRLRQSILAQAFRGKLAAQVLTEEPASALLARIRAEHHATVSGRQKRRKNEPVHA